MTDADTEQQYRVRLAAILKEYPGAVVPLESAHPIRRYTCLVYAFGFTEFPDYVSIARGGFNGEFAGPDFAHWMIDQKFLKEIAEAEAQSGDFVFYLTGSGRIKHAGIYLGNNRVRSKWGLGELFEHDLFAIPESYGATAKNFRQISFENALEAFKQFAKEMNC